MHPGRARHSSSRAALRPRRVAVTYPGIVREEAAGFGQAGGAVRREIAGDPPGLERCEEGADARPRGHAQRQDVVAAERQALRLPGCAAASASASAASRIAVGICRSDADEVGVALAPEAVQVARALGRRGAQSRGSGSRVMASSLLGIAVGQAPALGDLLGGCGIARAAGAAARRAAAGDRCRAPARAAGPGARARPAPG